MRFLRFSLRRLLILTGLVAVLLYLLLLRPVAIAKQFIHELQTLTDLKEVSDRYFHGLFIDEGTLQNCDLEPRTWADVFACRQRFSFIMSMPLRSPPMEPPMPLYSGIKLLTHHNCYSTPFRVKQKNFYTTTTPPPGSTVFLTAPLLSNSIEQNNEYLARMVTVKKGDKIEDVVQKMKSQFSTEPYDIDEINEIYGTKVTYSVGHGRREHYITFWFGKDDRLIRMSTNIEGATFDPATDINTKGMKLEDIHP